MATFFVGCIGGKEENKYNFLLCLNVAGMNNMFTGSSFNGNISQWNVSSVTRMQEIFQSSVFNQDISGWNTVNVSWMFSIFLDSIFDQNISGWDVSNAPSNSNFDTNTPVTWIASEKPTFPLVLL